MITENKLSRLFFFLLIILIICGLSYIFIIPGIREKINTPKPPPLNGRKPASITTLQYLKSLQKEVVTSAILTNTYEGTIVSINKTGGKVKFFPYKGETSYAINIKIMGETKKTTDFYYGDQVSNLNSLFIYNKTNEDSSQTTIQALEIGDRIIINQDLDLLKSNYPVKVKTVITKI